jgi:hypothetical protein
MFLLLESCPLPNQARLPGVLPCRASAAWKPALPREISRPP